MPRKDGQGWKSGLAGAAPEEYLHPGNGCCDANYSYNNNKNVTVTPGQLLLEAVSRVSEPGKIQQERF